MATIHRASRSFPSLPFSKKYSLSFKNSSFQVSVIPQSCQFPFLHSYIFDNPIPALLSPSKLCSFSTRSAVWADRSQWFMGQWNKKTAVPDILLAGDPVLHEPAADVVPEEIGSEKIQKIIDDIVAAMRKEPAIGLCAPQIGYPFRIIALEDTPKYIGYVTKEYAKECDRHPFDLLVIVNPKLKKKGIETAIFFEGCVSVVEHQALVERHLEVEVTGFGRDGEAIRLNAKGWKARILQHECDHLDGFLYVDKMVPRTFRINGNSEKPLANGCPKIGVRSNQH